MSPEQAIAITRQLLARCPLNEAEVYAANVALAVFERLAQAASKPPPKPAKPSRP